MPDSRFFGRWIQGKFLYVPFRYVLGWRLGLGPCDFKARAAQHGPSRIWSLLLDYTDTLCQAIVFPGRKSGLPAGFLRDSSRTSFSMGSPAGRRPAGGPILRFYRLESSRNLGPISGPEALVAFSCQGEHTHGSVTWR